MKIIDLRSDTITKPSPEMWEMVKSLDDSNIGDDVFREDPTVNELEKKAAKITGKEASICYTHPEKEPLKIWLDNSKILEKSDFKVEHTLEDSIAWSLK